jgi:hypothetical protein
MGHILGLNKGWGRFFEGITLSTPLIAYSLLKISNLKVSTGVKIQ